MLQTMHCDIVIVHRAQGSECVRARVVLSSSSGTAAIPATARAATTTAGSATTTDASATATTAARKARGRGSGTLVAAGGCTRGV